MKREFQAALRAVAESKAITRSRKSKRELDAERRRQLIDLANWQEQQTAAAQAEELSETKVFATYARRKSEDPHFTDRR